MRVCKIYISNIVHQTETTNTAIVFSRIIKNTKNNITIKEFY